MRLFLCLKEDLWYNYMGGNMYKKAILVLNKFHQNGYLAYIVGGYPRDTLLGIKTKDIDICTNAKPKEIMELFDTENVTDVKYGSVKIIYKNCKFDVTTFRKDIKYEDNRKPIKIKYINNLKKDLLRRDFTINTICIDKDGNYVDLLNVKEDIDNKIIKTVGNPRYKLMEDSLRILRAIRFASILDFTIDKKTENYIIKYGYLLKKLSGVRKKEELNKIFASVNKEKSRKLITSFGLDKHLGINNINDIVMCDDIIGIWSQLDLSCEYPFSKSEKELISKIKKMLELEIDKFNVYKYGLYVSTVVGSIKGISYKKINDIYNNLKIYSRSDINIKAVDIAKILNKDPGNYLSDIFMDIEKKIINEEIDNNYECLCDYIKNNY